MIEEYKYKKRLHRNRPFLLLGNEIDGRLFCKKRFEFSNFKSLRDKLPLVIDKINGEGEWAFDLYQVPKDYRIWNRYGYYQYPNRGTKLFTFDYMNLPIKSVKFDEREITFIGTGIDNYSSTEPEIDVEINRVFWESK